MSKPVSLGNMQKMQLPRMQSFIKLTYREAGLPRQMPVWMSVKLTFFILILSCFYVLNEIIIKKDDNFISRGGPVHAHARPSAWPLIDMSGIC